MAISINKRIAIYTAVIAACAAAGRGIDKVQAVINKGVDAAQAWAKRNVNDRVQAELDRLNAKVKLVDIDYQEQRQGILDDHAELMADFRAESDILLQELRDIDSPEAVAKRAEERNQLNQQQRELRKLLK